MFRRSTNPPHLSRHLFPRTRQSAEPNLNPPSAVNRPPHQPIRQPQQRQAASCRRHTDNPSNHSRHLATPHRSRPVANPRQHRSQPPPEPPTTGRKSQHPAKPAKPGHPSRAESPPPPPPPLPPTAKPPGPRRTGTRCHPKQHSGRTAAPAEAAGTRPSPNGERAPAKPCTRAHPKASQEKTPRTKPTNEPATAGIDNQTRAKAESATPSALSESPSHQLTASKSRVYTLALKCLRPAACACRAPTA